MYGKIFASMYDGTLKEDWKALVTFQQMIVLADVDGIVDITPSSISGRTGIPLEIIEHGIAALSLPDASSRTPTDEGKRINLLDDHRKWGWYIVNYEIYRDLRDADMVRFRNRDRKQKQRAREAECHTPSHPVTPCHAMSRHIDIDIDTDTNIDTDLSSSKHSVEVSTARAKTKPGYSKDFEEFWQAYPSDRRGSKKRAFIEWRKLDADKGLIIGDILNRVKVDKLFIEDDGKFVPHAERWLSGERWLNDIKPVSRFGDVTDKNIRVGMDWVENGL